MTNHWNAETAEAAIDLLDAAREHIEAALKVAYPGARVARIKAQKEVAVRLSISLDTSALEQLGTELHTFNAQVNGTKEA